MHRKTRQTTAQIALLALAVGITVWLAIEPTPHLNGRHIAATAFIGAALAIEARKETRQ